MIRNVLFLTMLSAMTASFSSAAVTLTFDTGTDGFIGTNGGTVLDESGQLEIGAPGGADFFESGSRAATLNFTSGSAIGSEMALALANGGTISFDYSIAESDINWVDADRPGILELQLALESGGSRDTEVALVSVPAVGATRTGTFSADVVSGTGNQFNGTNGTINYTDSGTLNFAIGLKDGGDFITDAVFRVDNFSVAAVAVPEPSSLVILAIGGVGFIARRRRSVTA
jgi:hypothetical protein